MELVYPVQQYAWGKTGSQSAVALLAKSGNSDFTLDESAPYAELWLGTHPNGPAKLLKSGQSLKDYLDQNPDALGESTRAKFGDELPFLFKVLSVNKALSIQAHPDKELAQKLHAERPDLYKDPNHKPEMIIALTDFEALCDFRPIDEIKKSLSDVPELAACIGKEWENLDLRDWFTNLMKCDPDFVKQQLLTLKDKLTSKNEKDLLDGLFLRLHEEYPGDVGCFVIYFLSYHKLAPGEALFLEANVPHAYLSGDGMECMAASDNVVRSGLTPKYIDTETLCSMLTYECPEPGNEGRKKVIPVKEEEAGLLYVPGVPDFAVSMFLIEENEKVVLPKRQGPSIFLVVSGAQGGFKATNKHDAPYGQGELKGGSAIFIPAGDIVEIISNGEPIKIFQAFC